MAAPLLNEATPLKPSSAADTGRLVKYREDIDGLRAVALLAVVTFHINPAWLPGGFLGVDTFFVISGFVVTGSILGGPQPSVCDYFAAFYARRLKRLTPALVLLVVTVATLVAALADPTMTLDEMFAADLAGALSLVGGANIYFSLQQSSYWDTTLYGLEANPFLHCWSLGVEEQYYLLFPAILLALYPSVLIRPRDGVVDGAAKAAATADSDTRAAAVEAGAKVGAEGGAATGGAVDGSDHAPDLRAGAAVVASCALLTLLGTFAGATAATVGVPRWTNFVFYLLPFHFWELATGAVLCLIMRDRAGRHAAVFAAPPHVRQLMSACALLLFALSFAMGSGAAPDVVQQVFAILAVAATVLFILAGVPPPGGGDTERSPLFNSLCASSAARYVGKVSYQLYLWHWPAILCSRQLLILLDEFRAVPRGPILVVMALGALATTVGLVAPLLSYHVIEAPLRAWTLRTRHGHLTTIAAMLALIFAGGAWMVLLRTSLDETIAFSMNHWEKTPSCPASDQRAAFENFVESDFAGVSTYTSQGAGTATFGAGSTTVKTAFGRSLSGGGCACRFCDGLTTTHQPRQLTDDSNASLCFSTYPLNLALFKQFSCFTARVDDAIVTNEMTAANAPAIFDVVAATATRCLKPDRSAASLPSPTLFLLGTSISASLQAGLAYAVRGRYQIRLFAQAAFGILPWNGTSYPPHGKVVPQFAARGLNSVYDHVRTLLTTYMEPGDLLCYLIDDDFWLPYAGQPSITHRFEKELIEDIVERNGGSTIVFSSWPHYNQSTGALDRSSAGESRQSINRMVARHATAHHISMYSLFCSGSSHSTPDQSGDSCGKAVPGTVMNAYLDTEHLNTAGSIYLWPHLCDMMQALDVLL